MLHPRCSVIVAPGASLSLGPGCVVEENAIVRVLSGAAAVGEHTVFMVGCSVDLVGAVGAWNTFSPRCRVEGVRVGDHCTFGAGTTTTANDADRLPAIQADGKNKRAATSSNSSANFSANTSASDAQRPPKVPDRTVIYGATSAPRTWDGSGEAMEKNVRLSATEFLREVLPK